MSNTKALFQRKADLTKHTRALLEKARAENRGLNEEEEKTYKSNVATLESLEEDLKREAHVLELERSLVPITDSNQTAAAAAGAPSQKSTTQFSSLGEQLMAIVRHERSGGRHTDQRLFAAASGASEAVPSDGGFLVQKDFSTEVLKRVYETGQVSSRVRRIGISPVANGLKVNAIDETSRADGSRWGGVQAYWMNEADALTATKPKFRQIELNLQKMGAVYYATDEVLQDASALEAIFTEAFSEEMGFKLESSIISGNGAGQPLGILNSGSVISVAKDGADSGATVSTNDILSMWERLWARSRQSAVWYINQDVEKALYPLVLGSGSLGQILLYTPPGTANNAYGSLFGRPVIPIEHCSTLGTVGDIILADLSTYLMIDKGAPQQAASMHVRFLNDEMTFRTTYRVDGQPWWNKPLTPKNGSNTLSPFITLAVRA
jgi:HK97 family phage major capsid protein